MSYTASDFEPSRCECVNCVLARQTARERGESLMRTARRARDWYERHPRFLGAEIDRHLAVSLARDARLGVRP